ncbi:hypothetical protein ZEAMMB73_Zm00001d032292 [Zea mays]|uniref:Uncharacterized protein n=1 Tax=Zea mays TaxID=4577 RepID=A0A1D6KPQ6_MAIZE|nr:hypothetical protein ZEAMMB73_Zm00001d032292 [Zea mays]
MMLGKRSGRRRPTRWCRCRPAARAPTNQARSPPHPD